MKYYVKINGVSSETIQGLKISELPSISKPLCRSTREEIDGRDGDIITKLGYSAYDKTLKIGLWGNYDINQVIAFFNQEGKITFSNEPDKYYIFTILNRADFINQLEAFRTASITIHCQPFKYMEQPSPEFDREYVEETGTDLTFNNSVEAPIVIDLKGNTSQKTLSGKNLMNLNLSKTQSGNGITYGVASDGTITINGTASANVEISYLNSALQSTANNAYTINFIYISGRLNGTMHVYNQDSNNGWKGYNLDITGTGELNNKTWGSTFNVDLNMNGAKTIRIENGSVLNNLKFKLQFVKGTTDYNYEPYCGGIPSPNPSYPQNVNVVSGDNNIVVCGKNLFDMNTISSSSIITINNNQTLTINGTGVGGVNFELPRPIILKANTTYTMSLSNYYANDKLNIIFRTTASGSNVISVNTTSSSITPNEDITLNYLRIFTDETTTFNNYTTGISITNDNSGTYEAYNGNTYPINLPVENLLNITNKTETINDVECKYQDGIITLNGTCSSNGFFVLNLNTSLPSGNYSLSANNQTTTNADTIIRLDSNNTNFQVRLNNANASYSGSYNATISTLTIRLNNGTQYSNFTFKPQLEKGLKVNSYTPYGTTPIELCKIGDYQDYIYKEDDKWYLHKEITKVVLDGTNIYFTDRQGPSNANNYRYVCNYAGLLSPPNDNTYMPLYCNRLTSETNTRTYGGNQGMGVSRTSSTIITFINEINGYTLGNANNWLKTHELISYLLLKTPTNTEIIYQPLLNQLNALQEASSYEGTTNIYQVNNDLPFIITASVLCGAAKFIVNNIGNTIAKPVMTIEGSGNIGIYLNNIQIFTIALGDEGSITLDIANMEAYKDGILKNRLVVGDYNSFVLQPGNNTISFSGDVVECEIKNYSRWL